MPSGPDWLVIAGAAAAAVIALALAAAAVRRQTIREPDDYTTALLLLLIRVYARVVHRVRFEGLEHAPRAVRDEDGVWRPAEPVILAPVHTAGVDPLLIQTGLRYEVRWMMAADMREPILEPLWTHARIIFVDRGRSSSEPVRTAVRHVRTGHALGVFPEGHIERPPRHLLPFREGIGFLVRRTGAAVLPVVIEGTPQADPAWASLWRPSASRVRFLPPVRYDKGLSPEEIAGDIRRRIADATGWPMTDRAPIFAGGRRVTVDLDGRYVDESGREVSDAEVAALRAGAGSESDL